MKKVRCKKKRAKGLKVGKSGRKKKKKVLCANERKTNKNIQTHLITVGKQENVLACVSLHASKASVHAAMDV